MSTTTIDDMYRHASAAFATGDITAARELLERCVDQDAAHLPSRFALAVCLHRLGDLRRAEAAYVDVLRIDADYQPALDRLASLRQPRRAAPAPPPPIAAVSAPRSLAEILDGGKEASYDDIRGGIVKDEGRLLLSHRRLWAALGCLMLLPLLTAVGGSLWTGAAAALSPLLGDTLPAAAVTPDVGAVVAAVGFLVTIAMTWLSSKLTRYRIFERQIEIERGVLFRTIHVIRMYDVIDVTFRQNPLLLLAGTGALEIKSDKGDGGKPNLVVLTGMGSARFLRTLQHHLLHRITTERRSVKKQFL